MNTDQILQLSDQADTDQLKRHVEKLASYPRFNHDRHGEPLDYLHRAFSDYGLEVTGHTFSYKGQIGVNLIGHKFGTNRQIAPLIVCAHYDTVDGSVGADDNASGLATMLESARILKSVPLERTVEFVALDMEETQHDGKALVGSEYFVRDIASKTSYVGVINLEAVGYTSGPGTQKVLPGFQKLFPDIYHHLREQDFSGNSLAVISRSDSNFLSDTIRNSAGKYLPDLDVLGLQLPDGLPIPTDLLRSDHASFWSANIPAVMVTDTADFRNPHYHSKHDTPETLDYEFLRKITNLLTFSVATSLVN